MDTAARVVTTSVAELRERNLAGFLPKALKRQKRTMYVWIKKDQDQRRDKQKASCALLISSHSIREYSMQLPFLHHLRHRFSCAELVGGVQFKQIDAFAEFCFSQTERVPNPHLLLTVVQKGAHRLWHCMSCDRRR